MSSTGIFLDAHATTPIAKEALSALVTQLGQPGNPHSPHAAGAVAHEAIETARKAVAELIGAAPGEIVFTSGATEANNIAIIGLARASRHKSSRRTIVTSAIEHPSVLEASEALTKEGFTHLIAPVGEDGRLDLDAFGNMVGDDVLLVSVMAANNVSGIIQPVQEVAAIARAAGAMIHCDAAQAGGRLALDVFDLDVDLLSLSAHKMYGPPGVGALYVSAAIPTRPDPIVFGGGQEQGLRSGTAPAGLIAAFGVAARLALAQREEDALRLATLTNRFTAGLEALQVRYRRIGTDDRRLPGSLNIAFDNCDAQELTERLSTIVAISTGSACSSGQISTSPVLDAMRLPQSLKRSSVRICFNRYSTEADADNSALALSRALREIEVATGSIAQ
ncbi:cysteine desulfurase family protein [Caulobacter sp. RHG1]|uniref:cysteine desulfurase family protein n=1 Tax=Caulobacter sp. (strain RHG1) TaxID=2545762 RepID=UPI001554A27E|nr:cysteine desulfurase family protein [Caulobacter sp. RHG1]NQE65006.1 Cysteine desulfurase [Caulobacter sp. RHG1]